MTSRCPSSLISFYFILLIKIFKTDQLLFTMFLHISIFIVMFLIPGNSIRSFSSKVKDGLDSSLQFEAAPEYKNGNKCPFVVDRKTEPSVCNPWLVHVAMTLDPDYLRGTMAAIHSVLKHASCPEIILFHFVSSNSISISRNHLAKVLESAFSSLRFHVFGFDENLVKNLISTSFRPALENPLNYARSYLADMLEMCVKRVIYLDSDIIAVDDIDKLWRVPLTGSRTIGAPEHCQANFTNYFTQEFWSDVNLSRAFDGKKACYFNTGVMVMELERWRQGDYTKEIEKWMRIQKERRIYELGSLPPFLLVFGGDVEAIEHRWNQHGLGGDNVVNSCTTLHPGPVTLLHWSGKGKAWRRLDENKPSPVDSLWAPYDLHKHTSHPHIHHQKRRHR